jgi:hypothetical protein
MRTSKVEGSMPTSDTDCAETGPAIVSITTTTEAKTPIRPIADSLNICLNPAKPKNGSAGGTKNYRYGK